MNIYENIESYCGLSCKDCEFSKNGKCGGCAATGGNPFHGDCRLARCAAERNRHFCGECGEYPCDLLKEYAYDPEHGDNGKRIENCQALKNAMVAEARKGTDPVSYCGHHCDCCFMGQWCGGCRSSYNCCSLATLYEDGICPNKSCADSRGLDGCYDCPDLIGCKKGYYEKENSHEYAAKATALFIQKYGKERYTAALKQAVRQGMAYAGDLDKTGSVNAALTLLETYLV